VLEDVLGDHEIERFGFDLHDTGVGDDQACGVEARGEPSLA